MMIKSFAKKFVGAIRIRYFQVKSGKAVYIGKNCKLKGKEHIVLESSVIVRPYAQIWASGGRFDLVKVLK